LGGVSNAIPGLEDTEEADLGAEMLGIGGNFDQCFRAAAEQQAVDQCLLHCMEDAPGIDGNVTVGMGTFAGKQIRLRGWPGGSSPEVPTAVGY
jgi:hypothetical protein